MPGAAAELVPRPPRCACARRRSAMKIETGNAREIGIAFQPARLLAKKAPASPNSPEKAPPPQLTSMAALGALASMTWTWPPRYDTAGTLFYLDPPAWDRKTTTALAQRARDPRDLPPLRDRDGRDALHRVRRQMVRCDRDRRHRTLGGAATRLARSAVVLG
jgi:hypothetical protein